MARTTSSPVGHDAALCSVTHVGICWAEITGLIRMMVLQPVFFICGFTSGDVYLEKLSFVTAFVIFFFSFAWSELGGMELVFVVLVVEPYYPGMVCILKFTSFH